MAFRYDKENQCFSMELNHILFSCEAECQFFVPVAERLAKKYRASLPFISEYIVTNPEFIETYGAMSKENFMMRLENMTIPWVFLRKDNSGTIAYGDSAYIIEFRFYGDFEKFSDFNIYE